MAIWSTAHIAAPGPARHCGLRDTPTGMPIFVKHDAETTRYALDGAPILFPTDGSIDPTVATLFSGQLGSTGVVDAPGYHLQDSGSRRHHRSSAGWSSHNLPQQDMVALRAVIRLGFALPNPINRANQTAATRLAFAALQP